MTQARTAATLITGASSGIGEAYALEIARRSDVPLILVARRHDRLLSLKAKITEIRKSLSSDRQPDTLILTGDLTQNSFLLELHQQVSKSGCYVDTLINNAGFGTVGPFARQDMARQCEMVRLNCEVTVNLCAQFLPDMISVGAGTIINVSSIAAKQPMPFMATYAATKSFILSFSLGLYEELRPKGIHVLAHCPGPTESEFHLVAGLKEKINFIPSMTANTVVRQALAAVEAGKPVVVNGVHNRLLWLLASLLPAGISAKIVRFALRRVSDSV